MAGDRYVIEILGVEWLEVQGAVERLRRSTGGYAAYTVDVWVPGGKFLDIDKCFNSKAD